MDYSDVIPPLKTLMPPNSRTPQVIDYIWVQEDKPIIVLNGKTLANSFNLNSIDPKYIATIDVLKDDAAEVLYGAEVGQCGVILIVTKASTKKY